MGTNLGPTVVLTSTQLSSSSFFLYGGRLVVRFFIVLSTGRWWCYPTVGSHTLCGGHAVWRPTDRPDWTAQEEQNSMAAYVYNQSPSTFFLTLLTGLVSKEFNKDRIREIICKNPIPGTDPNCPNIINSGRTIATLAGGLVGGFLGGPGGALAGGKFGYDIGSGKGILDFIAPQILPTIRGVAKRSLQIGQRFNRSKRYGM